MLDMGEKISKNISNIRKKLGELPLIDVILLLLILFGGIKFSNLDKLSQKYTDPNFIYQSSTWSIDESYDLDEYQTEWNVRNGSLIITNQAVVEYDGEIILLIDIMDYYDTNEATLKNQQENGEMKSLFDFYAEKSQKEKLESFMQALKELLWEKMNWTENVRICKIYDHRLLHLDYQNMYVNSAQDVYYLHSDAEIRILLDKDVKWWDTNFSYSLDEFNIEDSLYLNEELSGFVEECVNRIRKK